jgi:hypothetical protein
LVKIYALFFSPHQQKFLDPQNEEEEVNSEEEVGSIMLECVGRVESICEK